jgi:hypothetical protein
MTELSQLPDVETEPQVIAYRESRFMKAVVAALERTGLRVDARTVPADAGYALLSNMAAMREKLGDLTGVLVVTDDTVAKAVEQLSGREPVRAYEALQAAAEPMNDAPSIARRLRPIVDELRAKGLTPVVVQQFLGDHLPVLPSEDAVALDAYAEAAGIPAHTEHDEDERLRRSSTPNILKSRRAAAVLARDLEVPVIPRDAMGMGSKDHDGVAVGALQEALAMLDVDADKVVLLVDHHAAGHVVRSWKGKEGTRIALVCPCCVDVGGGNLETHERMGTSVVLTGQDSLADRVARDLRAKLRELRTLGS